MADGDSLDLAVLLLSLARDLVGLSDKAPAAPSAGAKLSLGESSSSCGGGQAIPALVWVSIERYIAVGVGGGVACSATPASGSHSRVARAGGVGRRRYIYSGVRAGCWDRSTLPEELS